MPTAWGCGRGSTSGSSASTIACSYKCSASASTGKRAFDDRGSSFGKIACPLYELLGLARERLALRLVVECLHVDPHIVRRASGGSGREERRDPCIRYRVGISLLGDERRKLGDTDRGA